MGETGSEHGINRRGLGSVPPFAVAIVELGVRHVRDGGANATVVSWMKDLASRGIRILQFLFLGGAAIPPPGPVSCDIGEAGDPLGPCPHPGKGC